MYTLSRGIINSRKPKFARMMGPVPGIEIVVVPFLMISIGTILGLSILSYCSRKQKCELKQELQTTKEALEKLKHRCGE